LLIIPVVEISICLLCQIEHRLSASSLEVKCKP
jgi:hypothetical protein